MEIYQAKFKYHRPELCWEKVGALAEAFRERPRVRELVLDYEQFLRTARSLSESGNMRYAGIAYGVVAEKAKLVADSGKDIETTIKYLRLASEAAALSDTPASARGLRLFLDLYTAMRDNDMERTNMNNARNTTGILEGPPVSGALRPSVDGDGPSRIGSDVFTDAEFEIGRLRREVLEGVDRSFEHFDGKTGIYLARARFRSAEALQPEALDSLVRELDALLVDTAGSLGLSYLISPKIISMKRNTIGIEGRDQGGILVLFRHNGIYISINEVGYIEIFMEKMRCDEKMFSLFKYLVDATAFVIEKKYLV